LTLRNEKADWTPLWSIKRGGLRLDFVPSKVETRPADNREPNVKKGGVALGVIAVPQFVVITCMLNSGSLDLVVPGVDQRLVEAFFRARIK
jgi:hypothetical protein